MLVHFQLRIFRIDNSRMVVKERRIAKNDPNYLSNCCFGDNLGVGWRFKKTFYRDKVTFLGDKKDRATVVNFYLITAM